MAELLISQTSDFDSPLVKYFSFIVLGLMLSVGYLVLRSMAAKKKREAAPPPLELLLKEAETEAWRRARDAKQGEEAEALALPPTELQKQEGLKRIVASSELQDSMKDEMEPAEPGKDQEEPKS